MSFGRKQFHKWLHRLDGIEETARDMMGGAPEGMAEKIAEMALMTEEAAKSCFTDCLEMLSVPTIFPHPLINRFALNSQRTLKSSFVGTIVTPKAPSPGLAILAAVDKAKQREQRACKGAGDLFREIMEGREEATPFRNMEAATLVPQGYAAMFRTDPLYHLSEVVYASVQINDYVFGRIGESTTISDDHVQSVQWPRADALQSEFFRAVASFGYDYPVRGRIKSAIDDAPEGWASLPPDQADEPVSIFPGDFERMQRRTEMIQKMAQGNCTCDACKTVKSVMGE